MLLFQRYPSLFESIAYEPVALLPTPVERLTGLLELTGHPDLFIKRDNLTSPLYGGNKIRKFDFIFPHAKKSGAKTLLTVGGIGSNHNLATAIHGKKHGFNVHLFFFHQPLTRHCRETLLLCHAHGAFMHYTGSYHNTAFQILKSYQRLKKQGEHPYFIYSGASTPLGNLGYVNAAFELKEQVEKAELPEPDFIYVAQGSAGTVAGLALGLKLSGLRTKVVGVRVVDHIASNARIVCYLANRTIRLLRRASPEFPSIQVKPDDFLIEHGFFGQGYGIYTKDGNEAIRLVKETCGLSLEGTYTGKAFAAYLHAAKQPENKKKVLLFWNTHNSASFDETLSSIQHHYHLPEPFHPFFNMHVPN